MPVVGARDSTRRPDRRVRDWKAITLTGIAIHRIANGKTQEDWDYSVEILHRYYSSQ
jgi:hypothetical protein